MVRENEIRANEVAVDPPAAADAALTFIGRIRTPWTSRSDCPHRGDIEAGPECRIEIDPRWTAALEGIGKHENLQVLYWMHLSRRDAVRQNPAFADHSIGTFAIRSPLRPNPVASTVVRLLAVEGNGLTVRGLDCVDGTPLIDLKPEFGALWCNTSPQRR